LADDDLAAQLADMRSRHYPIRPPGWSVQTGYDEICASDRHRWPCHAHIALAAVEAVLELPAKWDEHSTRSSALEEDRMWIRQDCADDIREAIRSRLLPDSSSKGEEGKRDAK
jgi:hypothetical protein